MLAVWALADVHLPNFCPTGTASQSGRTVGVQNNGETVTITVTDPAGNKDTSIHIWWWITPAGGGTGSGDSQKANTKKHQTQTSCKATIPISASDSGGTLHWVVAFDKWIPSEEDHEWTWGTEGTQSL
jgi:hypothetical protein